jgi:hypothetical protein
VDAPNQRLFVPHTDCFFAEQHKADTTIEKIRGIIDDINRLRAESAERRAKEAASSASEM